MEIVGSIASVGQISVYMCGLIALIQEVREAIRKGPAILQERGQQLDILSLVVGNIRLRPESHSDRIAVYLVTVQDRILRLQGVILRRLHQLTSTGLPKLKAAFAFTGRDKEVTDSFTSLQQDCNALSLLIVATNSGTGPRAVNQAANIGKKKASSPPIMLRHRRPFVAIADPSST